MEPAPHSAGGTEAHRVSLWNLVSDAWLKGVQAKVIFSLAVPFCTESWADDNTDSYKALFCVKRLFQPVTKWLFVLALYFGLCAWGKCLLHGYNT